MSHKNVIVIAGQSPAGGASAIIDPGGILDLHDLGAQTAADLAALYCDDHSTGGSALSYAWGDIRGHNSYYAGAYVDGQGNRYKCGGIEVGLNRYLYAQGYRDLVFINFWMNYSSAGLQNGHSRWCKGNTVWNQWTSLLETHLAELTALGHTYSVEALVWEQGIDDALLARTQVDFEADTRQIFTDFRADYASATTPIVIEKSVNSSIAGSAAMAPIRAGQIAMAADYDGLIDPDGLTLVDTHHVDYAGQLDEGEQAGILLRAALGQQVVVDDKYGYIKDVRLESGRVATIFDGSTSYSFSGIPPTATRNPDRVQCY